MSIELLFKLRALRRLGHPALACLFIAGGCHRESSEDTADEKPGTQVHGGMVRLSEKAPGRSSLAIDVVHPLTHSTLAVNGRLVWDDNSTVRVYTPVAGRVTDIPVELGDEVKEGQALCAIFSPDFGQAQADASKADADFRLARRTLERLRDLLAHGAAAQKDLEAAEDDFENKQSELKRAIGRLQLYGGQLGVSDGIYRLQTPLRGVLVEKHINPGQEVRPDAVLASVEKYTAPLFVVSDPTKMWVLLDVTELDLGRLQTGQKLTVRSKAFPRRVFEGKLEAIGNSLDPQTRTIYARGSVENPDRALKAEMYVAVEVESGVEKPAPSLDDHLDVSTELKGKAETTVEVPVKAVFSRESQHFVYVEKAPGEYERHGIEIGSEREGRVAVTAGLKPGDRIVTDGCLLLESIAQGGGKD